MFLENKTFFSTFVFISATENHIGAPPLQTISRGLHPPIQLMINVSTFCDM